MKGEEQVRDVASEFEVTAPRRVIQAGPAAVAAYQARVREADAVARQQQREREAREAEVTRRGIKAATATAKAKGEKVEEVAGGPVVVGRDGLLWLERKGKLHPAHLRAGLKFRQDWSRACSSLPSSLNMDAIGGGGFGPKAGVTDSQIRAREAVVEALKALGTPLLHPYVLLVAAEGEMLSGPKFGGTWQKAEHHLHPCIIAFDMLARHYGMIR